METIKVVELFKMFCDHIIDTTNDCKKCPVNEFCGVHITDQLAELGEIEK